MKFGQSLVQQGIFLFLLFLRRPRELELGDGLGTKINFSRTRKMDH
jgi:hypothetical protein